LAIILATAFLFIISLLTDSVVAYIGTSLYDYMPTTTVFLVRGANILISFFFVTVWFAITFKYLPDAHLHWRPIWIGAALTGLLFMMGKFILNHVLINSRLGPIYGPSASILLIMLFVFYSSMILFYGASFTKTYADYAAFKIKPKPYAEKYKKRLKDKLRGTDQNFPTGNRLPGKKNAFE